MSKTPPQTIADSTYILKTKDSAAQEIQATRIGVNESGALLVMRHNPATMRHEPIRIIAPGHWNSIELAQKV